MVIPVDDTITKFQKNEKLFTDLFSFTQKNPPLDIIYKNFFQFIVQLKNLYRFNRGNDGYK